MCGITGFTNFNQPDLISAMNAAQFHRGPDDEGFYIDTDNSVCMAMRRLSIVDAEHGHQPMRNKDDDVVVVFNGEIFNAQEIRRSLEARGFVFTTRNSDTEALLNLYLYAGKDLVRQLNGMFAFCLYDKRKQKLFAARDPFGIKPFYYSTSGGRFAFASELKSLVKCPWIEKDIDRQAAYDFFTFQTIAAPHTIYSSISKLPAAHCLEYDLKARTCSVWQYWHPTFSPIGSEDPRPRTDRIRTSFVAAVQRWSQSDVPIACSLSGGIDSAAIVAALASTRSSPVDTYTVGFSQQDSLDETAIARLVARRWGTNHHEIIIDIDSVIDRLDKMIHHLDEPYAGGLPSWFVYEAMRDRVKVAMTGTGGDELFGNYGKWRRFARFRDQWYLLRQYYRKGGLISHALRYPHGALHYPYFSDGEKKRNLFTDEFANELRPSAQYIEKLWPSRSLGANAVTAIDLKLQLPEEFLFMTDRFSMAFSIEARTPFLDLEFATEMLAIPVAHRTDHSHPKKLFIESMGDLLPIEVTKAPKRGFVLPQGSWMREGLRRRLLELTEPAYLKRQGIFREDTQTTLIEPFLKGQHDRDWEPWNVLMFQLWDEARVRGT
jgi:asparagine synthase (glutamine-hydrolysing)